MKPNAVYLPLAAAYGEAVALRNLFFETGIFRIRRVNLPVISVGNVSTGGTGKTPFVILLANMLSSWGLRPAVVARGYGRASNETVVVGDKPDVLRVGDEPALIAQSISGMVLVADSKRKGAEQVAASGLADVILVDDGFQHRSLARDLDIVLVTSDEVYRPGHLLPAGYRREPVASLSRAELVVVTGCRGAEELRRARLHLSWLEGIPIIGANLAADDVREAASGRPIDLHGRRVVAVSGIGNPASFERTLKELGAIVAAHRAYPDHHWFSARELGALEADRNRLGAERIVTTEKDAVRMGAHGGRAPENLAVVSVRQEIIEGMDVLQDMVRRIVTGTREAT